jgi:hypothetical protein
MSEILFNMFSELVTVALIGSFLFWYTKKMIKKKEKENLEDSKNK